MLTAMAIMLLIRTESRLQLRRDLMKPGARRLVGSLAGNKGWSWALCWRPPPWVLRASVADLPEGAALVFVLVLLRCVAPLVFRCCWCCCADADVEQLLKDWSIGAVVYGPLPGR